MNREIFVVRKNWRCTMVVIHASTKTSRTESCEGWKARYFEPKNGGFWPRIFYQKFDFMSDFWRKFWFYVWFLTKTLILCPIFDEKFLLHRNQSQIGILDINILGGGNQKMIPAMQIFASQQYLTNINIKILYFLSKPKNIHIFFQMYEKVIYTGKQNWFFWL